MPLNKPKLIEDLEAIYDATLDNAELTPAQAKAKFINDLATAIDEYVKTAKINYTGGLTSATGGVVTGTFNGSLS